MFSRSLQYMHYSRKPHIKKEADTVRNDFYFLTTMEGILPKKRFNLGI